MRDPGAVLGLAQEALDRDRILRQARAQDLDRGRARARGARRDRRWRCRPRRCTPRGGSRRPSVQPCCRRSWIRQATENPTGQQVGVRDACSLAATLTFRRARTPAGVARLLREFSMRRLVISRRALVATLGCGSWNRVGSERRARRLAKRSPRSSTAPSSISGSAGSPPASRCRSSGTWPSPPGRRTRSSACSGSRWRIGPSPSSARATSSSPATG